MPCLVSPRLFFFFAQRKEGKSLHVRVLKISEYEIYNSRDIYIYVYTRNTIGQNSQPGIHAFNSGGLNHQHTDKRALAASLPEQHTWPPQLQLAYIANPSR